MKLQIYDTQAECERLSYHDLTHQSKFFNKLLVAMDVTRANCLRSFVLFVILQTNHVCFSQWPNYPYKEWIEKLSDRRTPHLSGYNEILSALKEKDLSEAKAAFNMLESKGRSAGSYFIAR